MIAAEGLTKRYRRTVAVDRLSFEVAPGRVTGFLGPNGAGKSTTMRLMLGLDRGAGVTTFDGTPLQAHRRPSELVGILLEAKAFHPTRTARQHLRVSAAAGDVPAQRVDESLAAVGLGAVADRRPGKFSLGMAQRLGIAAAVLAEPRYLILDEPANGLDPEGMAWLRKFLRDYARRGNGVFISSHQLGELAKLVDDVVVIGRGRLIARGPMRDVLASRSPSTVFVRSPGLPNLRRLFGALALGVRDVEDGVEVAGISSADIGVLALEAGIPLEELTPREASLEEVFFELTEDVKEFEAVTPAPSEGR